MDTSSDHSFEKVNQQIDELKRQFVTFLTNQQQLNQAANLTFSNKSIHNLNGVDGKASRLCMQGTIRTDERCPVCQKLYSVVKQCQRCSWRPSHDDVQKKRCSCGGKLMIVEVPIICPVCHTKPDTFYLDFSWKNSLGESVRTKFRKDPQTGRMFDSWQAVHRFAESIRRDIDQDGFNPSNYLQGDVNRFKFMNYAVEWFDKSAGNFTAGTLKTRKSILNKYLIPMLGQRDIRKILGGDIEDMLNGIPNISATYRKNILTTLQAIFSYAFRRNEVTTKPTFPSIKIENRAFNWLTRNDQYKILEVIPENHRPIFEVGVLTGMRPAELRALKWDCIFFNEDLIIIKRTFSGKEIRECTKDADWRIVPMSKRIREILESQELVTKLKSDFVFLNSKGNFYKHCLLFFIWHKACDKVGIKITLYEGTKHSLMTQKLNQGVRMDVLSAYCGHSDTYTTKKYAKFVLDTFRVIVDDEKKDRPQ